MNTTILDEQVSTLNPSPKISREDAIIRPEVAGRDTRKEAETGNTVIRMGLNLGRAAGLA